MKKALFLDRDGVINIDYGYVHSIDKLEFIPNIFELVKKAIQNDYLVFIITNQAGIARGYYSLEDFKNFQQHIEETFIINGAKITKTYFCPHHPDFSDICDCRKPKPGMLSAAARDFNIDLSSSILIGDKLTDIEAGTKAGVLTNILLDPSYKDSSHLKCFKNIVEIIDFLSTEIFN